MALGDQSLRERGKPIEDYYGDEPAGRPSPGAPEKPNTERMTDEELASIIRQQEQHALSLGTSDIANERALAMDYYLGKPFGNEVEGRSQVVSTDVFDTVEGLLPPLLEIFTSSNKIAECEPYGMEDIAEAKQQTEAANYVLFKQNNAPLIFYTWFKDALLQKNGVVKYYYDDQKNEYRMEKYANLLPEELQKVAGQDHIEIVAANQHALLIGDKPVPVYDVELKVYTKRGRIKVVNIPPENFLVTSRHTSIDLTDCEFCAHREKKTKTDILEMGFTEEDLADIGAADVDIDSTPEALSRQTQNLLSDEERTDDPMKMYDVSDVYILIDYDGDGIAELRHIFKVGNKILSNEETDHIPFAVISPVLLPHQFYGLSIADITMDIQKNKSSIHRQSMDSLYFAMNPRVTVLENMVDIEDVMTSRPGGIIRAKTPNAVTPWVMPFVGKEGFSMLEYWEGVKESRTGVTRYNQGLDADSLNKTAHGISQIMTAAMKRQELIARIFAETGVKALVRGILHCLAKSGMKQLIVRLTNGYQAIDPRQWKNQYDVTINVALGSGTKERQLQLLGMISAKQLELKQTGRGYMISEANDYNVAAKLAEAAGYKNPELFFTDPSIVPEKDKVPPPNPDMLKLEQDGKLKVADMQVTTQQKDKDMANDRAIEQMKAQVAKEADIAVAQIMAKKDIAVAQINAEAQLRTKAADIANDEQDRKQEAEIKVFDAAREQEPINAAKNLDNTADQLIKSMQQMVQGVQVMGEQMIGQMQAMMEAKKVTATKAKKGKDGKLVSTIKEYADGSSEEIPHMTIQ